MLAYNTSETNMNIKIFIFALVLFLPLENTSPAESLAPADIVKQSDDLMRGDSYSGIYTMEIKTKSWKRELKLQVDSLGRDKIFIRILSPAKEAGTTTLRIKNEMWNYLPKIEKVIKIPPSLMLQPWMGSDFANDDLVKEGSVVHDYTHKILSEIDIAGESVYQIELQPNPHAPVIWGKVVKWIRKKDFVPLKEEYYNEKGKLIKILEYSDIGKVSDRTIPKTWTMSSMVKPANSTTIKLVDVKYNQPINEKIFSLTHLRKIQ